MDEGGRLHPVLTVRLYTDQKCFGPGVAMLLRRVRTLHSLRAAAMDMNMAYSKAWTILRTAERELDRKLVHSTTGGRQGGGAVLTEDGQRLLDAFDAYEAELRETARRLFPAYFGAFLPEEREELKF